MLIDTSFLLAYVTVKDKNHYRAKQAIEADIDKHWIVPAPVLIELFYMITVRINYSTAVRVFVTTRDNFTIVPLVDEDMERMQQIMMQYHDAQLDFTDTSIMALAERLNITTVYTFDRRDFSIFRPKHCAHLQVLP